MAKGFKQGGFDILIWEVFRGAGRQTGRELAKGFEKQVKKRAIDTDSSHRKLVNRFNLPGTFKGASSKMYTLIDSFYNEYVATKALFQASIYLQDDIDYIERKLSFVNRLIYTEAEERAYDRLIDTWTEYKQQALNSK